MAAVDGRAVDAVPPGAHEWVSFEDPDEDRTWLVDVTFLASSWRCIYGDGCQGVLTGPAPELVQGCCSYGAHFTDDEDAARVEAAAAELSAEQWQFRSKGRKRPGVVRRGRDGEITTRLVDGACIFLNRPGFAGGPGCALHRAALERRIAPLELKPDVCWQLPLRREDLTGATGHVTTMLGEWGRRDWGAGGREFHWWCTEAPEAFGAGEGAGAGARAGAHAGAGARADAGAGAPVYRTLRAEIVAMAGEAVYDLVASYLDQRLRRKATVPLPHPAVRRP